MSDLGNKSQVPVISFTATSPTLTSGSMPYFLRATPSDAAQVNCIAALIKGYGWREVVPIYEDTDYGRGIIPYLVDSLQEFGASVPYRSVIPVSASSDQVEQELYKLMTMQTRVYIVHMSSSIASTLFTKAKELGMMSEMYAWILTDGIANIVNSLNPPLLDSMNGALGVKFYVPKSKELDDFTARWDKRFKQDYPNDPSAQLGTFGLRGYDTIRALAQAAEKVNMVDAIFQKQQDKKPSTCFGTLGISTIGPKLIDAILHNKFRGLSGDFDLKNRQLQPSTFEIINVIGRSSQQIGFWTAKHGIIRTLDQNGSKITNANSMPELNPVIWPGKVYVVPKGWQIPTNGKKLRVGVTTSGYPEFMKVERDPITNATTATGYAIDVFEEVLKGLPYAIPYEYVAFGNEGASYNDFVYQVHLGVRNCYSHFVSKIKVHISVLFSLEFFLSFFQKMFLSIKQSQMNRCQNQICR